MRQGGTDKKEREKKGPGHHVCRQGVAATEKTRRLEDVYSCSRRRQIKVVRPMQAEMVVVPLQKGRSVLQGSSQFARYSKRPWDEG